MKWDWRKKLIKKLAVISLLGTYIPSLAICTTVVAQALEKKNEVTLLDNDFLKVTSQSESDEQGRHWKVSYTQKDITNKRNIVFSIYHENQPIAPQMISEETLRQFDSSDGLRWHQKSFTEDSSGSFSFTTPNEKGWYLVIHDLEENETNSNEEMLENTSYVDLMEDAKVGPYDLEFDETASTQANTISTSEEISDTISTSTEVESSTEEEGYTGFRNATPAPKSGEIDDMDVDSHASTIVPQQAISTRGIFEDPNTQGDSSYFEDFKGNLHKTGYSADYRAYYIAGQNNRASIFSREMYQLDFSQDFEGKVYVSFGKDPADGFAFVMQRDNRKAQAITAAHRGSSLGVYGDISKSNPAEDAIKNAIAIEFDMIKDEDMDAQVDSNVLPHIAYTAPGREDSYLKNQQNSIVHNAFKYPTARMYGETILNEEINSATSEAKLKVKWYPFTFKYEKGKGFTYELGKYSTTGEDHNESLFDNPVTIPEVNLFKDLGLNTWDENKKVYWGFTGANGKNGGMTGFAFAKLPVATVLNTQIYTDSGLKKEKTLDSPDKVDPFINLEKQDEKIIITSHYLFKKADGKARPLDEWKLYWDGDLIKVEDIEKIYIKKYDNQGYFNGDIVIKDTDQVPNGRYTLEDGKFILNDKQYISDLGIGSLPNNSALVLTLEVKKGALKRDSIISENNFTKRISQGVNTTVKSEIATRDSTTNEQTTDTDTSWYAVGPFDSPVAKGHLTLDAVPNLNFGTMKANDIQDGEYTTVGKNLEDGNIKKDLPKTYDGNTEGRIKVSNSLNADWALKLSLGSFSIVDELYKNESHPKSLIATLIFSDENTKESNDSKPIRVKSQDGPQVIYSYSKSKNVGQAEIDNSYLKDTPDKSITLQINPADNDSTIYLGTYQASMTWTLENTDAPKVP